MELGNHDGVSTASDEGPFRDSLAGQITLRALALVVPPIVVIGALAVVSLLALANRTENGLSRARDEMATQTIGVGRAEQAELVLEQLDAFVNERIDDVVDWSRASVIRAAAAENRPEVDEYEALSVEQVEAAFDGSDLLDRDGLSSRFLTDQIADRPAFAELFFTDANGFNIGATNPTSDFVQRDEEWWQAAWEQGAYVGPLMLDESAGVFSLEVAVRIDSDDQRPVGVIKAVVDAAALQSFADEFVADGPSGLQVLALSTEGSLLAETATDHDPTRIGRQISTDDGQVPGFELAMEIAAQSPDRVTSGYAVLSDRVAGVSISPSTRSIRRLDLTVPVERWITIVEQPAVSALAPLDQLATVESDLNLSARTLAVAMLALIALTVGISFVVFFALARRIADPIKELQVKAEHLANQELPALIRSLESTDRVRHVPTAKPIEIESQGEVAALADAFNSIQSTAIHLAASGAIGRSRDITAVLVNVGRRTDELVADQVGIIDALLGSSPGHTVERELVRLNRTAAVLRRNAESLLVLGGDTVEPLSSEPVHIDETIRWALNAVEHSERVDVQATEPAVIGHAVAADMSHLLAELIENATSFSLPESRVEVIGTLGIDGSYTISILDNGPGMSPRELARANALLTSPAPVGSGSATKLGLLVVGRLAMRHGVSARLVESATQGLTAKVTIPPDLLAGPQHPSGPSDETSAPEPEEDQPIAERNQGGDSDGDAQIELPTEPDEPQMPEVETDTGAITADMEDSNNEEVERR